MIKERESVSYKEILQIALPMILSQATETLMLFVDRLFLSRVSAVALSSSLAGGISNFVFQSFFIGLIGYTTALVAQYTGSGAKEKAVKTANQSILLSILTYPIILATIPLGRVLFTLAGHETIQIENEYSYFSILMLGSLFSLIRTALSGYFIGIGKTSAVLRGNILGMLINIPLNYLFIFGLPGFPAMGIRGAAIATVCGIIVTDITLLVTYIRANKQTVNKRSTWGINREIFTTLCRFGGPAGVELFLNLMAFNVGLQLLHSYGPEVAAAVTITFNYDAIAFVPMLGLGFATTSIVGRYMGAGNPQKAMEAGIKAWKLSLMYGAVIVLVFITGAKGLVGLFVNQFTNLGSNYSILAIKMLQLASIYTFADMTQLTLSSALRGAGDTAWVMRVSVILHWIYAALAIYFIRFLRIPPLHTWIAFIVFIICIGATMAYRYFRGKWKNIRVVN